jgi:hypothetical protein
MSFFPTILRSTLTPTLSQRERGKRESPFSLWEKVRMRVLSNNPD